MSFQTSIPLTYLSLEEGSSYVDFQKRINALLKEYTIFWESGDYLKIRQLGYQFYGLGAEGLHLIELKSKLVKREALLFGIIKPQLKDSLAKLNKSKTEKSKEFKNIILAQLQKDLPAVEAQQAYDALMVNQTHPIFSFGQTVATNHEKELELLTVQYVTAMSFGISADFLGAFRPALAAKPVRPASDEDILYIKGMAGELQTLIGKAYKKIYSLLSQKKTAEQLLDHSNLVKDSLEGYFILGGTILGLYLGAIPLVTNLATKVEAYKAGLRLNEELNNAIVLYSYLNISIANLKNLAERDGWLKSEQGRALKRPFKSTIPQGKKLAIKQVSNAILAKTGAMVQVEGLVKSLEIRDDQRPPKFSTFVILEDIQTQDVVTLRAHMFGLEDNGVAVGSYVKVNGFVVRGEHWLGPDETGLDIDRVNFTELSKSSWMDDLVFRMKAFFPLYKDGMNMTYTLN